MKTLFVSTIRNTTVSRELNNQLKKVNTADFKVAKDYINKFKAQNPDVEITAGNIQDSMQWDESHHPVPYVTFICNSYDLKNNKELRTAIYCRNEWHNKYTKMPVFTTVFVTDLNKQYKLRVRYAYDRMFADVYSASAIKAQREVESYLSETKAQWLFQLKEVAPDVAQLYDFNPELALQFMRDELSNIDFDRYSEGDFDYYDNKSIGCYEQSQFHNAVDLYYESANTETMVSKYQKSHAVVQHHSDLQLIRDFVQCRYYALYDIPVEDSVGNGGRVTREYQNEYFAEYDRDSDSTGLNEDVTVGCLSAEDVLIANQQISEDEMSELEYYIRSHQFTLDQARQFLGM